MHRFLFTFLCMLSAAFLFSCEKEDVPAKPTIVIDKQHIQIGKTVTVKAVGGKGIYHEWDFGNGQKYVGLEKTMNYDRPGIFRIKLTTINNQKEITELYKTVLVGDIFLDEFTVWNFNFNDPSGQPWDLDGTGPDVHFEVGNLFQYSPLNISQRHFPFTIRTQYFPSNGKINNPTSFNFKISEYSESNFSDRRLIKNWNLDLVKLMLEKSDKDPYSYSSVYYLPGNYPKVSFLLYLK